MWLIKRICFSVLSTTFFLYNWSLKCLHLFGGLFLEMLQPSLCLGMARVEGERLLVIGDGSFFHALLLTFLAHDDILRGKALQEFLLLLLFFILLLDNFTQPLVLCLQLIHLVQLLADEALG